MSHIAAAQAEEIIKDALAVQEAGAFAVVLECVPSPVAKQVTALLEIPTIGIGAGPETSGQVLVYHDLLGMLQHPHHAQFVPKFCKRYADVGERIRIGLEEYREDVENRRFPNEDYAPYKVRCAIASVVGFVWTDGVVTVDRVLMLSTW